MKRRLREAWSILRETVVEWFEDGVPARGAALAYYVLLSLGPLLVLVVGALEFFLTSEEARRGVVDALRQNVGDRAASTVETVLARAEVPELLAPESIVTVLLLLFGATAVFGNVQGSLNVIWGVEEDEDRSKKRIALDLMRDRARAFLMIVLTGVVIGASFLITSGAGVITELVAGWGPGSSLLLRAIDAAISFLFLGLLFGAIYRTLPGTRIEWSSVWVGGFATALLFVAGKTLVSWLLRSAEWTSYYGPGASVVAFLAWIYFSAQIFFLGAEFTWVWSRRRRRREAEPSRAQPEESLAPPPAERQAPRAASGPPQPGTGIAPRRRRWGGRSLHDLPLHVQGSRRREGARMADKSVTKVSTATAPRGAMGQKYLASGVHVAMRLWEDEPTSESTEASVREYEIVGYALRGRAELHIEGQTITLEPGDCWVVPKGARHSYDIREPFTAVEATSPPARVHARDEQPTGLE